MNQNELIEIYKIWRPTSLRRAVRLEKALKTPARIYYKDESVSPPGSLGIAISEAVEDAATHDDTKYSLGSVDIMDVRRL